MSARRQFARLPMIDSFFPNTIPGEILQGVVDEVSRNIQAPRPLILFSALTAISIAVQGEFDVRKPNGQVIPASLMLFLIADSGERKSTVENIFLEAIREVQTEKEKEYRDACEEWKIKRKVWAVKEKKLLKEIERSKSGESRVDSIYALLAEHAKNEPVKPRRIKFLYDDATPESLFYGLHSDFPSAGLISGEGGGILGGAVMREMCKLNSIWSGDSIDVSRKTSESFVVENARLTTSLMVQNSVFQKYMQRSGTVARGAGLWARFLVCQPKTKQGERFVENLTQSWEYRGVFSRRLREILDSAVYSISCGDLERKICEFSPEAKEVWLGVYNSIEREMDAKGRFCEMTDYASKLADNIARVAAIIHVFEGEAGAISLSTLEFSIKLCFWCSDEFYRIFVPPQPEPEEVVDARALDEWLFDLWKQGGDWVKINYIRKYGPNKIRSKVRLERALEELRRARKIIYSERHGCACIEILNP